MKGVGCAMWVVGCVGCGADARREMKNGPAATVSHVLHGITPRSDKISIWPRLWVSTVRQFGCGDWGAWYDTCMLYEVLYSV